jgi:hypothetical protein
MLDSKATDLQILNFYYFKNLSKDVMKGKSLFERIPQSLEMSHFLILDS